MSSNANPEDLGIYGHDDAAADASGGGGQGDIEGATDVEKMGVSLIPPSDQDHLAEAMDAAAPLMSVTSNQLTLLFQGEVYVFDSVSPEKVQAVLLLLGGCEVPTGAAGMTLSCQQDDRVVLHHSSSLDHLEEELFREVGWDSGKPMMSWPSELLYHQV
ncbi:hypothetical protein GW17_00004229 [Ensete ventricosum]|nr:hypothetical protein GW17_00004229 [Ensete ventricosum]